MGNYHTRPVRKAPAAARFQQSVNDFPLMVRLGRDTPSWELNRWGSDTLRFSPLGQKGYDLRGSSRSLLYKGKRESHRFTILDNEQFEYDIILKREPESNKLYLFIEGWEGFDFFRQPGSSHDPKLAGSYAVYRKETILHKNYNTGTGKICHIHRPKIIDSRGREVWGDLWIDRGLMCITIPEGWLSGAAYPVVVDPVIGCSSVGANYYFYFIDNEEYETFLADYIEWEFTPEEIEESFDTWKTFPGMYDYLLFNRYTTTAVMQGKYNVHFHSAKMDWGYYNTFAPVVFNDLQNIPNTKISNDEYGYAGAENEAAGWKQASLNIPNMVAANSSLWLGMISNGIGISFDYGGTFFDIQSDDYSYFYANPVIKNGQSINTMLANCGNYIADYRSALDYGDSDLIEELRLSVYYQNNNVHPKKPSHYDYKFSLYLESVSVAYTRTLTAGVTLTDSRKSVYNAIRKTAQTVKATEQDVQMRGLYRRLTQEAAVSDSMGHWGTYIRGLYAAAGSLTETKHIGEYYRKRDDTVTVDGVSLRHLFIFIRLLTTGLVRDFIIRRFLKSNEELVLKSCVCREITLESSIH